MRDWNSVSSIGARCSNFLDTIVCNNAKEAKRAVKPRASRLTESTPSAKLTVRGRASRSRRESDAAITP